MMQLLDCFIEAGYQITYSTPAEFSPHSENLLTKGIESVQIELNNESFDQYITDLTPDAVLFDRFMMEEQFGWRVETYCPDAIRVLDTEDLHCLRHARHQALKQDRALQPSDLFSDLAKREIAAILRCDLTVMISEHEMTVLQETFNVPSSIIHYAPFMLEPKVSSAPALTFEERTHFISIGNFRHEPNWDAVRYLKDTLWTGIRKQIPQAELHVYGAYPPKKATQLHNPKQGFHVKGWAPDAIKVMQEARVLLAPLRFGAGLKGKLVEAAQCGTPSVTTSIGAEGMYGDLQPAWIEDSPETFIQKAVDLYNNQQDWEALQKDCNKLIPQRFDKAEHQANLIKRISELEENLEEHRLKNFTGSMLRHHTMKSTKYMAQWIEAKNKLPEK